MSFDIVAVFGNKVECCFDEVERCFDIVAECGQGLSKTRELDYGLSYETATTST